MATTNPTVPLRQLDHEISTEISGNNNNATVSAGIKNSSDVHFADIQCFVCDVKVQGRHYALATCKTQNSKSKIIEKLGELVGERYMVVISEDDVICRSCANQINTLDRLDMEMHNVRDNILRFLEQKYSLEEGELRGNSQKPKLCQPPQITKCNIENTNRYNRKESMINPRIGQKSNNSKKKAWMQCDKCKYTTHHNSFMIHHIRDNIKQKVYCNICSMYFLSNGQKPLHKCTLKGQKNNCQPQTEEEKTHSIKSSTETSASLTPVEKNVQQRMSTVQHPTYLHSPISSEDCNMPLIRLSNNDNFQISNVLASESSTISYQPLYVRVLQHVNVNEELQSLATCSNADTDMIIKVKDNPSKQMLTLTEEGNLEMVEISSWNDVQPTDPDCDMDFS